MDGYVKHLTNQLKSAKPVNYSTINKTNKLLIKGEIVGKYLIDSRITKP
jgi:hypothetical protein